MKIFYYIKKGFPIVYNNLITITPVPGLKFTNWYEKCWSILFWYIVFGCGFLVSLAVNLKFYYQYQKLSSLSAYADLELGARLAYPAVYLCVRHPLHLDKLEKYRKNFLLPNLTMSVEAIESNLQHMFRVQRAAYNVSYRISKSLKNNVNVDWLEANIDKLFYKVDEELKDCSFQGFQRHCREIFVPVETALGQCFVFNSIFTDKNLHEDPHDVWYANVSEADHDWSLHFKFFGLYNNFVMVYLKYSKNLLTLNDFPTYVWHPVKKLTNYYFSISDQLCEEKLRALPAKYRDCYFPDETFSNPDLRAEFNTNFYDVGVCFNYCYAQKFMEFCNCWPIFAKSIFPKMASKSRICGIKDMECYENSYLAVRQTQCSECLGNCNGAQYYFDAYLQDSTYTDTHQPSLNLTGEMNTFEVHLHLSYWPLVHFRIINIFSLTELILAIASTACLFLGISMLSFMEAFYNLFIRFPFFYFVNWEYFITTIRKREELERKKVLACINMRLKPDLYKN